MAERKVIRVRVTCNNLLEIDTVQQTFKAELFIEARLTCSSAEEAAAMEEWDPKIRFSNIVETHEEVKRPATVSGTTVVWRISTKATLAEQLELQTFPHDEQLLTAILFCGHPSDDVRLSVEQDRCVVQQERFALSSAFLLHHAFFFEERLTDPTTSGSGTQYSELACSLCTRRRSGFYLWNVIVPVCCITSMGFAVFQIPHEDVSDRLQVSLTLVLTSVAFKYVVSSTLPAISYLTMIDFYVLGGFGVLALVVLENAVVGNLPSAVQFDQAATIALACMWAAINVAYALMYVSARSLREPAFRAPKESRHWPVSSLLLCCCGAHRRHLHRNGAAQARQASLHLSASTAPESPGGADALKQ